MKQPRIILLLAALAAIPAPSLAATPSGLVVGWGNKLAGGVPGVPFYGWAVPEAYSNSALASEPVAGSGQLLTNAVGIACGTFHALALLPDGRVAGWGWHALGHVAGAETPSAEHTIGLVKVGGEVLSGVTAISAGRTHSVALKSDGTVAAWGDLNSAERAGVPVGLSNVVAISAGWAYNVALRADGTVADWPASRIPLPLTNIAAIATGPGFYAPSLALKRDGGLLEWGPNGLLRPVPAGLTNVVAIAAGGAHCLALMQDGTVVGWGANHLGQATGTPQNNAPYRSEGAVTLSGQVLTEVVAVAAGTESSLALRRDGTVVAWGFMDHRQAAVPAGLSNVVSIAAGDSFCLAITTNANWAPPMK